MPGFLTTTINNFMPYTETILIDTLGNNMFSVQAYNAQGMPITLSFASFDTRNNAMKYAEKLKERYEFFIEDNSYPEQYLHVEECQSGETFIMPIKNNEKLNLKKLIKKWIKKQYNGELVLDGDIQSKLQGQYYASIYTDKRSPDSNVVWDAGGFFTKVSYE